MTESVRPGVAVALARQVGIELAEAGRLADNRHQPRQPHYH